MELLRSFAGFALCSCAALLMLPEGSLRKTASFTFGLMASLLWVNGLLQAGIPAWNASDHTTALTASGTGLDERVVYEELLSCAATRAAGCDVEITLDEDCAIERMTTAGDDKAIAAAAEILGIAPEDITIQQR